MPTPKSQTVDREICDGAGELAAWLRETQRTPSDIAHLLNSSPSKVHYWLLGAQRPRAEMRIAIECLTGGKVKATSWITKSEQAWLKTLAPQVETTPAVAA